jgi:tRNA (mo5U34)-methyltransferase
MLRGSTDVDPVDRDYDFWVADQFEGGGYPKLHFIEHRYAGDPTNWWVPNTACMEAMLRSAGFAVVDHPESEVYICRRVVAPEGAGAVYPKVGASRVAAKERRE